MVEAVVMESSESGFQHWFEQQLAAPVRFFPSHTLYMIQNSESYKNFTRLCLCPIDKPLSVREICIRMCCTERHCRHYEGIDLVDEEIVQGVIRLTKQVPKEPASRLVITRGSLCCLRLVRLAGVAGSTTSSDIGVLCNLPRGNWWLRPRFLYFQRTRGGKHMLRT